MNICDYSDRLELEDGLLVRVVTATARKDRGKRLDVYREYEDGRCVCRNVYTSMFGLRIGFPMETVSLYGNGCCGFIQELDDFGECQRMFLMISGMVDDASRRLIKDKYRDFSYVMDKWDASLSKTMDALAVWKEHREVEHMLAAGFGRVALNRSFWRMTERKRREVAAWMRDNPDCGSMSLSDILTIRRYGLTPDEFREYDNFVRMNGKVRYDVYRYLVRTGRADFAGVSLYKDYMRLLAQC